jgi:hypothetical protein
MADLSTPDKALDSLYFASTQILKDIIQADSKWLLEYLDLAMQLKSQLNWILGWKLDYDALSSDERRDLLTETVIQDAMDTIHGNLEDIKKITFHPIGQDEW